MMGCRAGWLHAVCLLWLGAAAAARAQGYAAPGPCSSTVTELEVQLPTDYRCTCQCGVKLIVRVPGGPGCPYPAPYPLVLFASGFQATSLNYRQYATRLASWGFAVLQYDFVKWSPTIDALCHSDAAEAGFMLHFLLELRQQVADSSSRLYQQLDLTMLAAAGHSRGGKIAAMHLAGTTPNVRAAYLVDPIDGSPFTKHADGYPSAVELLRGRGKAFGMTGAGRIGLCNGAPFATGNWSRFDDVAADGSWLEVVTNAGHLQFVDIGSGWDAICCIGCRGLVSQQEGMQLAITPMVAWFQRELRGIDSSTINPNKQLRAPGSFKRWVCSQERAGKIQFMVKGLGQICPQGQHKVNKAPEITVEVLEAQQMQARTRATEAFTSVSDAATDLAIFAASKAAISSEVTALAAATSKAIAAAKAGAAARAQAAAAARAAAKAKTS